MLLVRASKGPSAIHGIGLIARQFIAKGTRCWEFREGYDLHLTQAFVDKLPPAAREQILIYTYFDPRSGLYVLSGDDDRFTNHSANPNTVIDVDGDSSTAAWDIQVGEEITFDYTPWLSPMQAENFACTCSMSDRVQMPVPS